MVFSQIKIKNIKKTIIKNLFDITAVLIILLSYKKFKRIIVVIVAK
jgi:hypothetical protein